jgi:hypothetical protein
MAFLTGVCFAKDDDKSQWDNLKKLKPGQKIQVMEIGAIAREGKFKQLSQDEITLEVKNTVVIIPRDDVSRVVLKKSKTPGILIGLGIGAAIGLGAMGGAEDEGAYIGALVALPILAGGGAGVGALIPTSSIIYQRP